MTYNEFPIGLEVDFVKAAKAKDPSKGELVVWAYASTWDVDSDDCQITRQALEGAKNDLIEYSTVLFNHNYDRPVGRVVDTKIDDKGLLVKIAISSSEKEIYEKVLDGTLSKLSISGRASEMQETAPNDAGRSILQITKIKLFEVSIVSVPANKEAQTLSMSIQKALDIFKTKEQTPTSSKSLLAELELLSGRSTGEAKETIDKVISFFKTIKNEDETIMSYKFNDESDTRPIFQVNLSDSDKVELGDGHTFRKQILKKGKWHHWAADKGVLTIDDAHIDSLVKNFNDNILEKVSVPLTHTDDPASNTGEVLELIKTADGLDAIIEIKDETTLEKIKKGLITAVSASFDPNYMVKKTKEFVGPVLQHVALVAEPYIKGMRKFVMLSEEQGREVISLEDAEYDVQKQLEIATELLLEIKKHVDIKPITTEEEVIKTEELNKDENIIKAKVGDECTCDDGSKGTMKEDEDGKLVCKLLVAEIVTPPEVSSADSTDKKVEKSGEKKEEVILSDSESMYTGFLRQGKIVPSQKEAFIQLWDSLRKVQLTDSSVDVKATLDKYYDSQPKIVNFDEDGVVIDPTEVKPVVPVAPVEKVIPQDVKDFYSKMNLNDKQIADAWDFAQKEAGVGEVSTIFGN